jgi:hypothetical protein
MRKFIGILIATLVTMSSQASMIQSGNEHSGKPIAIATQRLTATRNAVVHANLPRIPKFKLLRGNPHRVTHIIIDDDEDDFIDDEGIMTAYRRRDLSKIKHPDDISEKVRWKLFLARQLALIKFREKWA